MKKVCVYKCKQCDAILDSDGFLILPENILDGVLESKEKGFVYRPSIEEQRTGDIVIHRCDPVTIGVCELIGWRKIGRTSTAPPNTALAWVSSSFLLARLSDAQQNPARTNPSHPVALANGTKSRRAYV